MKIRKLTKSGKPRASALKYPIRWRGATVLLTEEGGHQFPVCDFLRAHRIRFFHVPNESKRHLLERLALEALGAVAGVSDLIITSRVPAYPEARGVAIEMKSPKGKPTTDQISFQSGVTEDGWLVKICYSATEAIEYLQSLGFGKCS